MDLPGQPGPFLQDRQFFLHGLRRLTLGDVPHQGDDTGPAVELDGRCGDLRRQTVAGFGQAGEFVGPTLAVFHDRVGKGLQRVHLVGMDGRNVQRQQFALGVTLHRGHLGVHIHDTVQFNVDDEDGVVGVLEDRQIAVGVGAGLLIHMIRFVVIDCHTSSGQGAASYGVHYVLPRQWSRVMPYSAGNPSLFGPHVGPRSCCQTGSLPGPRLRRRSRWT